MLHSFCAVLEKLDADQRHVGAAIYEAWDFAFWSPGAQVRVGASRFGAWLREEGLGFRISALIRLWVSLFGPWEPRGPEDHPKVTSVQPWPHK